MKNKKKLEKVEEYIDFTIITSNFKDNELLKKEYPGVIEHDEKDLIIAKGNI